MKNIACLFTLWLLLAAEPLAQAPSSLLLNRDGQNNRYNGIGQLRGGSTCTAVLIKVSEAASAPAYALTNGHCINLLGANEVLIDQPPGGRRVVFNYFQDTTDQQITVNIRRVAWATMKGADLAVLELDAMLQSLVAAGLQPWELAASDPLPGEEINVVGIPVSGISSGQAFLRLAECVSGARVNLIEFNWHFFDMWLNGCADIRGGSSGSPVISVTRNQVIALINTTTAGSPPYGDCYLNRPCEVGPGGPRVRENTNYAAGLAGVRECFDDAGRFTLARAGCALDNGRQLRATGYPPAAVQPWIRDSATGALRRATWNVTIGGEDFSYYRFKTGPEEQTDCRNPAGYGPVIKLSEHNRFNDEIPEREGRYYFCLLGGALPAVDETWQPPRFATQVHVEIDVTPPRLSPVYLVRDLGDRWQVTLVFALPELSGYQYKIGRFGEIDCRLPAGYREYLRVPVSVSKTDGPQTFCLIGRDYADNQSYPRELLLETDRWSEIFRGRPPRITRSSGGELPRR